MYAFIFILQPPITDMYSSVRFNNNLHKDRQRKRQNMQQKGKYKQQSQSRLMYTQEAGQMKNGSYYRPSTPSISMFYYCYKCLIFVLI